MKILILGSGGREYSFAYHIMQSEKCDELYIAPGNGGTGELGMNIEINPSHFEDVKEVVLSKGIDMVIVGPELPLVEGIVDYFSADSLLSEKIIIGPDKLASHLEGSKSYAKSFMREFGIPTAKYREFDQSDIQEALVYLENHDLPIVLKADGLAAGKGVLICSTLTEAQNELKELLHGKFGEASKKVVIEEFLTGIEFSVFVAFDGRSYAILPIAKDYKRIGEGDIGLNTGGMGSVSPVSFVTPEFMAKVEKRIIEPTVEGIKKRKLNYKGYIFIGLIKVGSEPYVIEYNCRMGDPETQSVFARLDTDIVALNKAIGTGTLDKLTIKIKKNYAVTVVLSSKGYPESYEKGIPIQVPTQLSKKAIIHHAGTKLVDGQLVSNGGRVFGVTGLGKDMKEALANAYEEADKIQFYGKYMRSDIGFDL